MTHTELNYLFNSLLYQPENEIVEFKEAKTTYDFSKLGKYFSALSNEANLQGKPNAWLIFGVIDKTRTVIGSQFRLQRSDLDSLKGGIANKTTGRITFVEIYEVTVEEKRVIMFEIPAAPKGIPIAFDGHYYGRDGEELSALNLEEIERIRTQVTQEDWSAAIVENATFEDLDDDALQLARQKFKEKHIKDKYYDQIDSWTIEQLLDKAKVTVGGKITRAALLLLGNAGAVHKLSPHPAQITWKLETEERAYEHFNPPFLLTTTKVYQQIRNIKQKLFPRNQLIATEVMKYDNRVVLEALHNCLAHQDYLQNGRILVTERVDRLIFENAGGFFEGVAEDYFTGEKTPGKYRNPWLANAMVELGMIDTMGYGIHTMTVEQKNRFFPLPDYSKSDTNKVVLEIFGHSLDENYSLLLLEKKELDITTIILLDRVQKRLPISDESATRLKKVKLIEGRKPHYIIAAHIAEVTGQKAEYIKTRGLDDQHYKVFIIDYLKKFKKANKSELTNFILDKLPDILDEQQKQNKIRNILYAMSKKDKTIVFSGSSQKGVWILSDKKI
ncbi:RNA-binding domain-containing protein [Sulfuricurvum sp.]|uniref:RNA-binding domain-containing protein n=1 Tax=Sulfuricurvum sp. TaxID=2025608 RepID=UPI002D24A583|nr:RNA-binding domain-containing protein [Sulfuricurvum sp.]HZF70769.1 RNA-binding domain-containing protein [Sulfuricurvum sp.]